MGNIDWVEISELPEALKDRRSVLLWHSGAPIVGFWGGRWTSLHVDEDEFLQPSHFAEINPPDA